MGLNIVTIEEAEHRRVLKNPAALVTFPLTSEDRSLIQAMKEKLYALEGVGLAAPQVNVAKQIIVIYIPETAALLREQVTPYPMHVMINPSYRAVGHSLIHEDFEGCYSVASKAGKVPRYQEIALSYFDERGMEHQQIEKGFYARVLQHEIDHLNGVLIIDRLTADCVQGSPEEMAKLRRAELSEEKRALFDELMAKKLKIKESQ
ncbi:peptide deformylase [Legionella sp. km772]|uniref:peptide deformylase n=1 Tax=Legionella sp. km772 TaxID=2498111 RepID=UPI000F8D25A8|nr:peptide deformylase [Legionella sp. km772]RUR12501.1 peptide deformylase [Legionella sp. km772]